MNTLRCDVCDSMRYPDDPEWFVVGGASGGAIEEHVCSAYCLIQLGINIERWDSHSIGLAEGKKIGRAERRGWFR